MKRLFSICAALLACTACLAATPPGEAQAGRLRDKLRQNKTAAAPAEPLTLGSFAHAFTVRGPGGAVLSLELDETVYSGLARADFKDICVFDATGLPVPFMLTAPEDQSSSATQRLTGITLFPWRPAADAPAPGKRQGAALPGKTDIEIDTQGGIVNIRMQPGAPADPSEAKPALSETLLLDIRDALEKNGPPEGFGAGERRSLTLFLEPEPTEGFLAKVQVLASDDLERWAPYGAQQPLARIMAGDKRIDKLAVNLPVPCPRYVLLNFSGDMPAVRSATGLVSYGKRVATLRENSLHGRLSEDRKSVLYQVPGAYPLWAFNLDLPRPDVMNVRLDARSASSGRWHGITEAAFYRLERDGAVLRNDPVALHWPRSGEWRLSGTGDIPFAEAPAIRLYWKPHTLLFLARGQAPWTIAYGRAAAVNAPGLPPDAALSTVPAQVLSAPEGAVPTLPAQDAPEKAEPDDKDRMLLWGALALAVVFLTGIAVYLLRSMKKP